MKLTVRDFFRMFPDDDSCLGHIMAHRHGEKVLCPGCGREGKFHPLAQRRAFSCAWCGHHIYPCVGTPFEKSRTPLQLWFFAIFLFSASRNGVSAKELQRQLGVTYKTAWRMGHEIRKYMAKVDGDRPLGGHVEIDEAYIGGKVKGQGRGPLAGDKAVVVGILERGGDVITRHLKDSKRASIQPQILEHVEWGTTVSTDENSVYKSLTSKGFDHHTVEHGAGEYVQGAVHTNGIEGFWSQLKRSIRGTHVHVSKKHLGSYLGEFEFRYNLRKKPDQMFPRLILSL